MESCKTIRALAVTNKSFNRLINNPDYFNRILESMTYVHKQLSPLSSVIFLRTPQGALWLKQLVKDNSDSCPPQLIKIFCSNIMQLGEKNSTITQEIIKKITSDGQHSQDSINKYIKHVYTPGSADSAQIISFLIRFMPQLIHQKSNDYTPLMWAIMANNPEAVAILLTQGADQTIQHAQTETALEIAQSYHARNTEALRTPQAINQHKKIRREAEAHRSIKIIELLENKFHDLSCKH